MMRRMKIRAKPNFGIAGGGAPRSSSVAGRGSAAPVEVQGSPPQKMTSSPVEENAVCSSPPTDNNTLSAKSVQQTSGTQGMGNDTLSIETQEGTNKSHVNATTSSSSQMSTSPQPTLTSVQKMESFRVTSGSDELKQEATDSTSKSCEVISPSAESHATSEPLESDAVPVSIPQAQPSPLPQDNSGATVSQIITQTRNETSTDDSVERSHHKAGMPLNDKLSDVSKEAQQDSEVKSAVCMRRKKLKVKPMFGAVRKSSVIEKGKVKASDNFTNAPDIKKECVDEKSSVNEISSQEYISSPDNVEKENQNQDMHERGDADNDVDYVSSKPNEQPVEKANHNKETTVNPESSQHCEMYPAVKEVQQVREETELQNAVPGSACKQIEVEVVKDNTVVLHYQPVGDGVTLQSTSDSSVPVAGPKRRPRIRAKPTLITKKKRDDKDVTAKPVKQAPTTDQLPEEVLPQDSVTRSDSVKPDIVAIKLSTDSSETYQVEDCNFKTSIGAFQKEVTFTESEVDRKHCHLVNKTDNSKDSKESEQAQKIKREGIHTNSKENPESPLHGNLRTPRKKRLSENKETDPELEVVNVVNSNVEKQAKKRLLKDSCEEIVNSDDSTGDKENASTAVTELSKQEKNSKENSSVITQKTKTKSPAYTSKLFGKLGRKPKLEDAAESPDRTKKQMFRARKDELRKKMSEGAIERSKMTMFDLIYWNPASNPMPGRTPSPKRNGRSTSKGETDSIASELAEEQRVDDLGLDPADSEHQSRPESPEIVISDQTPEKPSEESKEAVEEKKEAGDNSATNEEEPSCEKDIFAPRVKIGPNGEIMVDEQSIKIQTTAAKNRDEVLSKAVVVEESGDSSHYGKWSKRRRRSCEWTVKETALFYKALSTVGTDFSLMATLIKWRTRAELKTKFKKEERNNRDLVDLALNDSTQFDMTVFEEESDYDPKEDRKAARQAERAEAKRRRMEMKQQDKIQEMEKKKLETKKNKAGIKHRKKVLRKAYRNRGRKRKETFESDNEDSPSLYDSDSASEDSVSEQPLPETEVIVKPRATLKRRQAKRRASLVISEVTVTMETVKYDKPAHEILAERTVKERSASPAFILPTPVAGGLQSPHKVTCPNMSPDYITPDRNDDPICREEQENEMILLNEYSELPLSEGLPESYIIEDILSENAESNPNITQMDDVENTAASTSEEDRGSASAETTTELQPCTIAAEPTFDDDNQRVWHFPVSAIQTLEDGRQVIVVPTSNGHYSVPVPVLPPGTSNIVVMATDVPDSPGELIYHVYVVSPVEAAES